MHFDSISINLVIDVQRVYVTFKGENMSKITTIGDWKVYKTTNWGTSWNWVAMHKDKVIDNFPTKKKAMEFVAQYIKEGAK